MLIMLGKNFSKRHDEMLVLFFFCFFFFVLFFCFLFFCLFVFCFFVFFCFFFFVCFFVCFFHIFSQGTEFNITCSLSRIKNVYSVDIFFCEAKKKKKKKNEKKKNQFVACWSCPENGKSLRKHAYSNILKISTPKTERFQIIFWYFFHFLLKT